MREYLPWLIGITVATATVLLGGGWFRRLAWRIGLVDKPKLRGVHGDAVARSGGMTVAAALLLALLAQMGAARAMDLPQAYLADVDNVYLLLPALTLLGLGLLDDLRPMGARAKLVVQFVCAVWAWVLGFRLDVVNVLGLFSFATDWFSLPLTVIFIVAITNAFNMLDGIDGLCAGSAFISLAGIGAYSLLGGHLQLGLAIPLAAACLAFVRLNLGKPKTFLGDSGSTFLGFVIAAMALRAVRTGEGEIALAPLFLLLSLPVVDITSVVVRRSLQGSNPLTADRGHIHHIAMILFDQSNARAVSALLAMAAVSAAGAYLAGAQPPLAMAVVALPVGLYATVYARGGYLNFHNLRMAAGASRVAHDIAADCRVYGPASALTDAQAIELLELLRISAIGLLDDKSNLVWCLGVPDLERDALELPLYAGGRVKRGVLLVQGASGQADKLAFAAQLMLPLYPAFMEMLESKVRATAKITKPLSAQA
ncbi:MAG: undecaprenyl/decaprenyl-phosphate alpha-N-acetylglucosaminyl 1-phosphate transferase [Planctomycetes bacterium]|nr:undecaprenyl/decaprenyl-phosphate alpha-N-acetylglucosaminyl 1-phosphate transferase [Planctomycetota bacterium]